MKFLETANYDWMKLLNFKERPFRARLIPSKVWRDLDLYRNDAAGLSFYFRKWRTRLDFLKEPSKAKVYKSYIAVSGEYDPEKRQILLNIHTKHFNEFIFNQETWDRFKFKLIQTLMHEIIHFMQYDRRYDECSDYVVPYKRVGKDKIDSERRYLSEFDEIQAYAHCVYLDFKVNRPKAVLTDLLASGTTRGSTTLKYILKTFNYDHRNNAAIPKLYQQIYKWDRKYTNLA
jgi:hypothetical protein